MTIRPIPPSLFDDDVHVGTSDEPLVPCTKCGHPPCPCCGVGHCDAVIQRRRNMPAEQAHRRAQIELGNGMTNPTEYARTRAETCVECRERFPAERAFARGVVPGGVEWLCSAECVETWIEGADDTEMCPCFDDGCVYPDRDRDQNARVIAWAHDCMRRHHTDEHGVGGGFGLTPDFRILIYVPKEHHRP